MGQPLPRTRSSRPGRPLQRTAPPPHPDIPGGGRADHRATQEASLSDTDRHRSGGRRRTNRGVHGHPDPAPRGPTASVMARRRRRTAARTGHDHRPISRAHDSHRRQESRPNPRRWRLARPRTRIRPRQGSRPRRPRRRSQGHPRRVHLHPLRGRRVLPPGLQRVPRRRDRDHGRRLPLPRPRVLPGSRHHPLHADRHRQRACLHLQALHPAPGLVRLTPPADPPLHDQAQRQGRALPRTDEQRSSLCPGMDQ